jgi:hypothetical protein
LEAGPPTPVLPLVSLTRAAVRNACDGVGRPIPDQSVALPATRNQQASVRAELQNMDLVLELECLIRPRRHRKEIRKDLLRPVRSRAAHRLGRQQCRELELIEAFFTAHQHRAPCPLALFRVELADLGLQSSRALRQLLRGRTMLELLPSKPGDYQERPPPLIIPILSSLEMV